MVIIGQMRSGTSAVAEVVHSLGVPVAVTMHAPIPPTYRPEWEDVELSMALTRWALGVWVPPWGWGLWLEQYLTARAAHAEHAFGHRRFALKSPLLALIWEHLAAAAGDMTVIRLVRPADQVAASEARALQPGMVMTGRSINALVGRALEEIIPDLTVDYPTLVAHPREGVAEIADAIGVSASGPRFDDAVSRIKQPTSTPRGT